MKNYCFLRSDFKEFTNTWEQEKFANIYQFASEGGTPSTSIKKYYENGTIPFIKVEDTVNKYIENGKYFITENGLINSSAWLVPENSIIFTNGATIGNVAINKIKTATKQGILGIIPKQKYDVEFIYYLLSSKNFQNEVNRKITIGTFAMITLSNLDKIKVNLPNYDIERAKISSLFSHLDSLITLHQRKLSSLKNLKNRLLDKMFCYEKSQFPSIRFKEFTNAWEQWKARDILLPYRQKNDKNLALIGYSVSNKEGFVDQKEFFDDGGKAVYADKKNSLIISFDMFAYNPSRINVGSIALFKNTINGLVSPIYEVFKVSANSNPDLIYLWFKSECFNEIVANNSNKSVRDTLNLKQFEDNLLNLPVLQEQNKIANLFSHLDSLITLHQRKLNSLKNIKNTLLEKMFV
ncbi:restriction endonuclease subunit S [Mycoplasmopsis agalactiae]|uniref:restriction endonuclease subunit S n=1 Tax=Mycoplasmopsis agalactiae TaxID=2110 RepID=UPI002F3F040A